jgi:hypothetical protein
MFEKWCTPWRERKKYIQQQSTKNREKEERVSLTTTPEFADDNIDEEGASLDEKISKVLRFDETDEDGRPANHPLVETPMTCDSVQSSSAPVAKQKEGEEKDGGGDEAESAPTTTTTTTTTTTGSFGTSFKEWMSTARKSWEFKRKSSSKEVEVTSGSSGSGSGSGGATAAPASSEEYDENNDAVVKEQTSSDAAPLHSRLEKLERDAKEKDDVIRKLQKRIEALEERLLLSSK